MEIKENCYKGTRILSGYRALEKRSLITSVCDFLENKGYEEIMIPIIQFQSTFESKVGEENQHMMFNFTDRGNREICLAPEYTAVVQNLATKHPFIHRKDVKLFYIQECFRGESPQSGRYRQFTQLGVEILNPTRIYNEELQELAVNIIKLYNPSIDIELNDHAQRGLDYYKNGKGFEISCNSLGAQKQICGGGEYENGIGFAIGLDRLLLTK